MPVSPHGTFVVRLIFKVRSRDLFGRKTMLRTIFRPNRSRERRKRERARAMKSDTLENNVFCIRTRKEHHTKGQRACFNASME